LTLFTWFVIAVLIAFNGLYVAAEFAAVSVRRSRIRQLAEEGDRLARELLPTLEDGQRLDTYIAACQVGITISSLVLGAYGQATLGQALAPAFERWGDMQTVAAQSASTAVVLVGLTTLQMVLGELVPKSVSAPVPHADGAPHRLPMRWSKRLLSWFVADPERERLGGAPADGRGHGGAPAPALAGRDPVPHRREPGGRVPASRRSSAG
jgi:putative hemolysin